MAHFRATIEGNRGQASRLGTKKSGIVATINGWDIGVRVWIHFDENIQQDIIHIRQTGGSGGQDPYNGLSTTIFEKPVK